jgi:hypothetical protein
VPRDERGRGPLATAPPQPCLSATVESLLMGRCFVDYSLISLLIEAKCAVARDCLRRPSCGISSLRAKKQILITLKMEQTSSYEKLVLTTATRCNVPRDIHHCYRRQNITKTAFFSPTCLGIVNCYVTTARTLTHFFHNVNGYVDMRRYLGIIENLNENFIFIV